MEASKIAKQIIEFQKATFNNAFTALVMVQDQTEAMFNSLLAQMPGMPDESKQIVKEWAEGYKGGREKFKTSVDEGFAKLESFFGEIEGDKGKKKA